MLTRIQPRTGRAADLRRSLRLVSVAWVFGAIWMYIATGAALTRYAKLMGVSEFGFGLMAALPFAGALVQLPTSYFLERFGHRKNLFIIAGIVHRLLWAAVAIIPWVLPVAWWDKALLWIVALSWIAGQIPAPAWVSWMSDLVPAGIRGRYFSRRTQLGQVVGLVVTVLVGYAMDRAEGISPETLRTTISVALTLAAICGSVDFLFFLPVKEFRKPRPDPEVELWDLVRKPLADRNFRRFLGFTATLTFAVGYIGQFIWLYLFDVVKMSNTKANVMLVVMPLVVLFLAYPLWGRVIDRFGCKPVLLIAGGFIVHGSTAWIFVTPEVWIGGYLGVILATAAWPGVELANFNLLLGMSESAGRQATAYVAINSLVGALAGIASGLFGGAVAHALGTWQGNLFGWPLTYHGVLFLVSSVLRLLSLLWLIGLHDPGSATTRTALRYMGTNLYSNLQQAVYMPGRLLVRLGRWTYSLNPKKNSKPPSKK